jgi:hypothetical protein
VVDRTPVIGAGAATVKSLGHSQISLTLNAYSHVDPFGLLGDAGTDRIRGVGPRCPPARNTSRPLCRCAQVLE